MCQEMQKEQILERIKKILNDRLPEGTRFTGKFVFTLDCHAGGIGHFEGYIQNKIEHIK